MMREFKFRAWDTRIDTMYPFAILTWNGGIEARLDPKDPYSIKDITIHHANGDHDDYSENYIKVMQYTGLKDSNGEEIYEGDITKLVGKHKSYITPTSPCGEYTFYSFTERVVFIDHKCAFMRINQYGGGGYLTRHIAKKSEVIGNIYENPELLNNNE